MPTRRQTFPRQSLMRRNIASLAAKLMAEDGVTDYGFAKRKAAKQLGAPESEALPTNAEVEIELRSYQALYQSEEQPATLRTLREAAADLMHALSFYNPYLTGSVLDGTAGKFSEIELDVFPDSSKELEIFLLNQNINFEQSEPKRSGTDTPECILRMDWNGVPVRLAIYPSVSERTQRRSPHGRPAERARVAEVEALIKNPAKDEKLP